MDEHRHSNCYFWAWRRFVRDGGYILIRRTRLSRLSRYADHPGWLPLRMIGIVLQWLAIILNLLGWGLRWGEWFHIAWSTDRRIFWEYVPTDAPKKRIIPPVTFAGKVRRVE